MCFVEHHHIQVVYLFKFTARFANCPVIGVRAVSMCVIVLLAQPLYCNIIEKYYSIFQYITCIIFKRLKDMCIVYTENKIYSGLEKSTSYALNMSI